MDTEYFIVGGKDGDDKMYNDWKPALTVLTTVDSQHQPEYRHHGLRQQGAGQADGRGEGNAVAAGGRAGSGIRRAEVEGRRQGAELGDRVEIYCTNLDQSTNAFDRYYIAQGDQIVDVWPIMGRSGAAQR